MLPADLALEPGPPPQAVIDKKHMWDLLIWLLSITLILRLLGLDIAGALLTGIMLGFSVAMTSDGMSQMAKYAAVFAMLCSMNFFFDVLPLITELGGRVTRRTEPGTTITKDGIQSTTYTITIKTTPFFDADEGFVYNMQSLAMIVSPICMALGSYLAFHAHHEIQQSMPPGVEAEINPLVFSALRSPRLTGPSPRGPRGSGSGDVRRGNGQPGQDPEGFRRFQGASYKLDT